MRIKTSSWYEVKAKYEKQMEDGSQKKVTEVYLAEASSCSEADETVFKELSKRVSGTLNVNAVAQPDYSEVIFGEPGAGETFYKVKTRLLTLDENTGKVKAQMTVNLVQALDIKQALSYMDSLMSNVDCEYAAVQETKIVDVYERNI